MTISSSLAAGVAGLNANAARLATISDNIANSSTYGYKKAMMDFSSLVGPDSGNSYTAGGVRTSTMRLIDERGSLINTNNPTDLAVSGRGLLPVTQASAITPGETNLPLQLVTTGSFRPDSDGILTSETGLVLMGWPANIDGTVPAYPRDTTNGLEPVRVTVNQFAGDPTTEITLAANLPATGTEVGATTGVEEMSLEYYGNMGTSELLDVTFTPTVPGTPPASNEWTMQITDSSQGGAIIAEYVMTFADNRTAGGTLDTVVAGTNNPLTSAYDGTTGAINVDTIHGNININIGVLNDPSGMTQLSNSFAPVTIAKDGSPVGNLTSVEVDSKGFVSAIYDIGFTRTIYQIPLVDVPNPNGLEPLANQAYQTTPDSGPFFLWDAGDGPWGEVIGYAREESATDVAAELTQLIQTQRAYSSNAKVIQTVDEMLQETTNIKR